MSEVTFDGDAHTISVRDRNGNTLGTWHANNRTVGAASLQYVPNGTYAAQDTTQSYMHGDTRDTHDGAFGTHGIVRFSVLHHPGIGIHSGRDTTPDLTPERGVGPDHVTDGCIRTTDEAMARLTDAMRTDPLTRIRVQHNHNQR